MKDIPDRYRAQAARRHAGGFTLIEIMIAVVVMGILYAIAFPSYQQYVLKSRRSDAKNALLDLASREERFFSVNNTYTNNAASLGYGAGATFPLSINASGQSYYDLNVPTVTAGSSTTLPGFVATATPTGVQVNDATCYQFQVDQSGAQTNLASGGASLSSVGCW